MIAVAPPGDIARMLQGFDWSRCRMMKEAIATIAPYFNSDRMMRRYAAEAYFR